MRKYFSSFFITIALGYCILFSVNAESSEYIIKFRKGAYECQINKGIKDFENRYLAKVSVYRDGEVLVEVRGSTLPDSVAFNKHCYNFNGTIIYEGRVDGIALDSKGTSGYLTIDPRDWEKFYRSLPDAEDWSNGNHTGHVVIVREGESDQECKIHQNCPEVKFVGLPKKDSPLPPPTNLRIVR